jgi:chromosome segregation ATPase
MTEQMETQADKIAQLESLLGNTKSQLVATEDLFQQSLLAKTTLENTKFDLLSEVSKLRLELTSCEQMRIMTEDKCRKLENELSVIRSTLLEKETEISALRLTLAKMARTTGYLLTDNELSLLRGKTFSSDYAKIVSLNTYSVLIDNYFSIKYFPIEENFID